MFQRAGCLPSDVNRFHFWNASLDSDAVEHGVAVDVLHHKEILATGRATNVVGGHDVGVVEFGRRFAFFVEAVDVLSVRGKLLWQKFDGHQSIKAELLGQHHGAHGARAELLHDLISRDRQRSGDGGASHA